MSEGDNPAEAGNVQASEPKAAWELFNQLESEGTHQGEPEEEEQGEQEEAGTEPQGDPKSEDGDDVEAAAEDDDADAGESDDEEPEVEKADPDETATVDIDGNKVTLAELKTGYLRQADYTRKTTALATERQAFDQAVGRVTQLDQIARQRIDLAETVLSAIIPPAPDPALMHTDFQSYSIAKEQRDQVIAALQQVQAFKTQSDQQQTQQTQEQQKQAMQAEVAEMVKRMPALATPEGRQKFQQEAVDLGAKYWGITPQEIGSIRSAKEMQVLHDAIAYRKLMAKQKAVAKKVTDAPALAKPGTRQGANDRLAKLRSLGAKAQPRDIFLEMLEQGSA